MVCNMLIDSVGHVNPEGTAHITHHSIFHIPQLQREGCNDKPITTYPQIYNYLIRRY